MNEWIINLMTQYGYLAVFFLIFIENVFPPIPSELILLLGGFMTISTGLNPVIMIIVSTLGSLAGAFLLYFAGLKLGVPGITVLLKGKVGKAIKLSVEDFEKSQKWFNTKGEIAVFLCRFVPLLRSLISVPAGIAKMNLAKFTALTVIGSLIWNTIFTFLGRSAGVGWKAYSDKMDVISKYAVLVLGVLFLVILGVFYLKKKKKDELKKSEALKNENNEDK